MNVLLIAPETNLSAVSDEVRAVSAALRPAILSGTVTRRDVLEALRNRSWDVIWFATHGDVTGIQLSDGHISVSDLTAVVRSSGAWLVVLNTCSSRLVGLELHYELEVSVITTQAEIDDQTAYQTGALLAQALAETQNVVSAFSASKPGQNQNYLLFHGTDRDDATETRTILMLNEWGARLSSKIDNLEKRMDREIGALRQDVNSLAGNVEDAVRLPPWHRIVFAAAFGLLFLPVPLFYSQVREWFEIGWQAALVLAFFAYLFSATLWSYMWWGYRDER
jgi:hypothetical protein